MSLYDFTQIGLESAIRGAAARQSALASNVANANTPGYRRQDVDFHSTLQAALSQGAKVGEAALHNVAFSATTDASAPMQADGNSVDIDVEQATLSKNGLEYEVLVTIARGRIDILKAAMGVM